ncbi:hypothetical protein [Pseudarthrobacter sp. NIBRBAC000502770]|uniref:hypothetical protein n=1 Tax=Pseudarthrobacter sp. NIBRBAC000502770 TaxID=2590785 RepID=UPI00113FFF9D|nr:hypothetical protein [Pseudarthrobacter sp. NIBRBAC000502770]QDG89089.1 hypothetical protein NIBR502770_11810 [Pseudarthrobacter sp. NIBRBAC000502770]
MATKFRVEALNIYCVTPEHGWPTDNDQIYLMGAMSNGDKSTPILVGDPIKIKNPEDTFEPLTCKLGDVIDLTVAAASMFQFELDVDETDTIGIALGGYSQSLLHTWASYEKLAGDIAAAAGSVLSSGDNPLSKAIGSFLQQLPTLIKDVSDLDKDTVLGSLLAPLQMTDLFPGNAFYSVPMTNGGHYVVDLRLTRDDRDYRAAGKVLQYPRDTLPEGVPGSVSFVLHNTGRQTIPSGRTQLTTVTVDTSQSPHAYKETGNGWFDPVPITTDVQPGQDYSYTFGIKAPPSVGSHEFELALNIEGIGIVPLNGDHYIWLSSGGSMEVTASRLHPIPILHGMRFNVLFSAVDSFTKQIVAPSTIQVYADGKLVGDATKTYPESVTFLAKTAAVSYFPHYELRADGYVPAPWEP